MELISWPVNLKKIVTEFTVNLGSEAVKNKRTNNCSFSWICIRNLPFRCNNVGSAARTRYAFIRTCLLLSLLIPVSRGAKFMQRETDRSSKKNRSRAINVRAHARTGIQGRHKKRNRFAVQFIFHLEPVSRLPVRAYCANGQDAKATARFFGKRELPNLEAHQ